MVNIMIVEDEKPISNLIALSLKKVGYHCECAYDGLSAIDMIEKKYPDLILLDIMLPGADGFEILEYVKPLDIPVIFLTAKGELSDKVNGLRLGAEDYIVKPFSPKELLARINALLRRLSIQVDESTEDAKELVTGIFTMNVDERRFLKNGKEIELTPIEFSLVKYFMENANKAVHRDEILNNVWGYNYVGDFKIVDVNIRRIRQKIEENPSKPKYIEKVWGYGYRWWGGD